MNKFNTGDKIVCTDNSGYSMNHLVVGQVYEVRCVKGVDIWLIGVAYSTKVWRFELYKGKP